MKLLSWRSLFAALCLAIILFFTIDSNPRSYALYGYRVINGLSAKLMCSGVFVAGRDAEAVFMQDVVPSHPLAEGVSYDVDLKTQEATVSIYGLFKQKAKYNKHLGCSIYQGKRPLLAVAPANPSGGFEWPTREIQPNSSLDKAMKDIFAENQGQPNVDTRALMVIKGGNIIAEKYALGFDRDSLFLSWSMAKSVSSSLIGIWADENKVDINQPVDIAAWQNDSRQDISLKHLLNMSSGLDFKETYVPGTDSTRMLFMEDNMAEFAASVPGIYVPGTHWSYSSGTTNILTGYLKQKLGGDLDSSYQFAFDKLFTPAGMHSAVFEPDASGSFVGSSYLYMNARDWAKFGQLYLQRGQLNGQQIVPEAWVDFVKKPIKAAPKGQYGGQFWLNAGEFGNPTNRLYVDCPADMYLASGHNGQFVAIIPSQDMVIVRLGWSNAKRFDLNKHFASIIAAVGKTDKAL